MDGFPVLFISQITLEVHRGLYMTVRDLHQNNRPFRNTATQSGLITTLTARQTWVYQIIHLVSVTDEQWNINFNQIINVQEKRERYTPLGYSANHHLLSLFYSRELHTLSVKE